MISVVIPTFNAARRLPAAAGALTPGLLQGLVRELIIVDGGSTDDTTALAEGLGARLLAAPKGRARQLIAGAAVARAAWLLFLHADTVLAENWTHAVRAHIDAVGADARAGAFRLAFDEDSAGARMVLFFARARAALFKLPYGDQGLLISRALYDDLGGYRDIALMEDVDLVRRIGPKRLSILPATAVTCAEKYRRDGYLRRSLRNAGLAAAFLAGADPAKLAQRYD
jgi:rSAM/selenodomain-associated transferase 2